MSSRAKPLSKEDVYGVQVLFSFQVGGSEKLGLRLAAGLDEPGSRWALVAARSAGGPIADEAREYGLSGVWLDLESVGRLGRVARLARFSIWLRERRVKVAHVHHLLTLRDTYLALVMGGVQRIVLTEHSWEAFERIPTWPRLWRFYEKRVASTSVVSREVQAGISRFVGQSTRSPVVIENGVDTEVFSPSRDNAESAARHDAPVIGWLGRLHPHKDVSTAIRAFARARSGSSALRPAQMLIGGEGRDLKIARGLIQELGLEDAVELCGPIVDVPSYLRRLDLLVISSITEGLPLVLLEAMAAKVPVVSTDVGGISEVLGDCGRLCPPRDPEGMAAQIRELLEAPGVAHQLAGKARERVLNRYSANIMLDRYRRLYEGSSRPRDT